MLVLIVPLALLPSCWLDHRDVIDASGLLLAVGGGAIVAAPWQMLRGLVQLRGAAKANRALEDARLPRATLRG